uniref:Trefoil factor 3 n=1 Tax=Gopherus agassizii TaxID=38772 RepID=A0A452HGQ5_9SAUR
MEHKGCWLLAIVLILGLSSLANGYIQLSQEQCAQQPSARVNCGYPYISAEECNNRGCCFDDSIVGVIWCFFPRTEEGNRAMGQFFPVPQYTENITVV